MICPMTKGRGLEVCKTAKHRMNHLHQTYGHISQRMTTNNNVSIGKHPIRPLHTLNEALKILTAKHFVKPHSQAKGHPCNIES